MKEASSQYKEIMDRKIRNHGYMLVSIGVIAQEAQADCELTGNYTAWSPLSFPFGNDTATARYATMEENYFACDGTMNFLPENAAQYSLNTAVVTQDILGTAYISFGNIYEIKGLTLTFEENCYPTRFRIVTDEDDAEFTNGSERFTTEETFGNVSFMQIIPLEMVGGNQRLRLSKITFGTGILFTNDDIINSTYSAEVSYVSEDLPAYTFDLSVTNYEGAYDIDNADSFINFFEIGQEVDCYVGLELDGGSIEWLTLHKLSLDSWSSTRGQLKITCKDKFSLMEEIYKNGSYLHERTLYDEAESILRDLAYEPDQYFIDDSLRNITIRNPMPESRHAECLQLIANAGRCSLTQDYDGIIRLTANFSSVLAPEDVQVISDNAADWSVPSNIAIGSSTVYADLTSDFMACDGSMYFLPETGAGYLAATGYVSEEISDSSGKFKNNPSFTMTLEAGYVYYNIGISFDGTVPHSLTIHSSLAGSAVESVTFTGLTKDSVLEHEFKRFDTMEFEFTETEPYSRVLVNHISLGDTTDYRLAMEHMLEAPTGTREEKVKRVRVKINTYTGSEDSILVDADDDESPLIDEEDDSYLIDTVNDAELVDDEEYADYYVNSTGSEIIFDNPLISSYEHAAEVAEWIGNYYSNNVTYSVKYRGDPRLDANDLIFMENEYYSALQVEIESLQFTFNGAFGGSLDMRRAIGTTEVQT